MKIIILAMFVTVSVFGTGWVWADEVDDVLKATVSERVRTQTRQMISTGVPKQALLEMTRMMVQNRFREQELLYAQLAVMNAHKDQVPVESVMNKAFEGMAKNVSAARIIQAMEQVRSRYVHAFRLAETLTEDPEGKKRLGITIAESLSAGMRKTDMDQIMSQLRLRIHGQERNQAETLALQSVETTRTMARLRVPSANVKDIVCLALQNRYTAEQMKQLAHQFALKSREINPKMLANQYAQSIRNGSSASGLGEPKSGRMSHEGDDAAGGSDKSSGGNGGGHGGGGGKK